MKQLLEILVKEGMVDIMGGLDTHKEAVREIKRTLDRLPKHLVLEMHRKKIGKIDGKSVYSEYMITLYIDKETFRRRY